MKTAILFPGQGSQKKGMGKQLAEHSKDAMDLWIKAEQYSKSPLREIFWESEDDALMADTANLQPAITVVNLALLQYVSSYISPSATAGHSLGEFSALAAAKVLSFDNILEAVALRGKLMSQADPERIGSMYAILRLNAEQVEGLCKEACDSTGKLVRLANRNTPGQFAVSGHKEALEDLVERAQAVGGKCIPLAVSGAFHTPLMAEASAEFAKFLDQLEWNDAQVPVYCNIHGQALTASQDIHHALRKQMTSSVYWIETIGNQWNDGVRKWFEFGPQGILSRMMRQIIVAGDGSDNSYEAITISSISAADEFIASAQ